MSLMYWQWWLLTCLIDVLWLVVSNMADWCDWCIETGGFWYYWLMWLMYWRWWFLMWLIDVIDVLRLVVSDMTDWCDWCIETWWCTLCVPFDRLLLYNVKYKNVSQHGGYMSVVHCTLFIEHWYWLYHGNYWGLNVGLMVSVEVYIYKNVHFYWICDSNYLGSMWQLNMYVDIGWTMPTIGGWM